MLLRRVLGSEKAFIGLLAVLLLVPQFLTRLNRHTGFRPTGARVCSGDEPHYLVLLNSLLNDGDLDLANNYASVHQGSFEAGEAFAGSAVDHHVVYYVGGERHPWSEFYDPRLWKPDANGRPVPTPMRELPDELKGSPERSYHLPGSTRLLAPVLFPFRGTRALEPIAILVSAFATFLGMLAFRELARGYGLDAAIVNTATLVTCGCTPVLHYSRSFFNEALLLGLGVGAYAFALVRGRYLLAAVLIAVGVQMKPPFLVLALPLAADLLWNRRGKALLLMLLPLAASVMGLLVFDWVFFGSPWRPPQPFLLGNWLDGIRGLLFSPDHGLFVFAPVAAIAGLAWPLAIRKRPRESYLIGSGFLVYFLTMAAYAVWHGGDCYGPRYLVPAIPLFMVPLGIALAWGLRCSRPAIVAMALICGLSLWLNLIAAVHYCGSFRWSPLKAVSRPFT